MLAKDRHGTNKGKRTRVSNGRDNKGAFDHEQETGQVFVSYRDSPIRATRKKKKTTKRSKRRADVLRSVRRE